MSLRAIAAFDRKLTDEEVALDEALDEILDPGLPLPARPQLTPGLAAALEDMKEAIEVEGEMFLAAVQNEGHLLFERDKKDFTGAGVDVSGFEGDPADVAVRSSFSWTAKFDVLWADTEDQIIFQGLIAFNKDEPWRAGWDLRVHSTEPVRLIGRSGQGVLRSVKSLVHANLLGVAVGLVNVERIESTTLIFSQQR